MDRLWWKQITSARKFTDTILDNIFSYKGLFLVLPEATPWYETLKDQIEARITEKDPDRSLQYIQSPEKNVGRFLLNKYCKEEKRAEYRPRPGYSEAVFLAQCTDIVMNTKIIWVSDIPRTAYDEWASFLNDYYKNAGDIRHPATIILETSDPELAKKAKKGAVKIRFDENISQYDVYTFCAMAIADTTCPQKIRPYLAEMVSIVCGNDVELCAECIRSWHSFSKEPFKTLMSIQAESIRSNGKGYKITFSESEVERKIWEAQIRHVFPALEWFRSQFISRHKRQLSQLLPIESSFGETYKEAEDIELGTLFFMVSNGMFNIAKADEKKKLDEYRKMRNSLAHIKTLPFEQVESVLISLSV